MIRILTLSILTFIALGKMSAVNADPTTMSRAAEFRSENIQIVKSSEKALNGKDDVPRPKRPPGPVEPGNDN